MYIGKKEMIMNKNITIGLSSYNKAIWTFIVFFLMLLLSGCDNTTITEEGDKSSDTNVTMLLKSGTNPAFIDNASIYVFTNGDRFVEKKLNVVKTNNKLSTYMPVSTWNLVLLTCNENIINKVTLPPYGATKENPMWKTGFTSLTNEFLSQTPAELRYASLPNTIITANTQTNTNATLTRNVAKIQVILKDYTGFDNVDPGKNNYAFVDLLDVPTTLDWTGGYFPNKNNPDHSGNIPIREYFNFVDLGTPQLQADTVNFIIPAHRGINETDLTTHHLRLRVSMPLKGESYYGKSPVTISAVPQINSIIRLIVTFRGEPETNLDVKVSVKPWEDIYQNITFE